MHIRKILRPNGINELLRIQNGKKGLDNLIAEVYDIVLHLKQFATIQVTGREK
jgi:hypothetical protein